MKKLFLPLFLSLCLFGNSQKLIIDDSVTLQKGIYKNFDEFKFNSPSIPFNYEVVTKIRHESSLTGDSVIFYNFHLSKEEKKSLKKYRIFGFCDGQSIYVREPDYAPYGDDFKKLHNIGLYSYFVGFISRLTLYSTDFPASTAPANQLIGKAININTGEIIELTKISLKSILKNDEELLKRFEEDDDKKELLLYGGTIIITTKKEKIEEYIIEYSKRHKLDGIYYRGPSTNEDMGNIIITRNECDTTDQSYIDRVYGKLKINPAFAEVRLHEEYYKNGQLKTIGIITKHDFISFEPITYRVGVWMSYYENGKPKEEIIYNITGSKLSSKKFNSEGKITK